jgi:hypothetical protein
MEKKGKVTSSWNWQVRERKGIKLSDDESDFESVDLSAEEKAKDLKKLAEDRMNSLRSSPEESKRARRVR